ncbi:MAG: hypothetical protein JWL77_3609 [Chthonomonadaceae bacterium]|nr:hypothetical protein [Chthonomonadaceae bacterium]
MMPYSWFLALERADSQTLFRENLERFGFLIPPASPKNPDALPLGFVEDPNAPSFGGVTEKRWVGLTCAACHTAAIAYKKQPSDTTFSTLIIDGGPTVANFGTFIHALAPAIVATLQDSDKYARFEQRVLGANPSEGNATTLKQSFTRFAAEFKRYIESSETPVPWGPGRVDAFGMIFNRVCTLALDLPQNRYAPNAPVSYPFLWNVNQQDHIQWHGEVENINPFRLLDPIDRLGRNTGEVMGVFARIDMRPGSVPGYASSVNLDGLLTLEYEMDKLKPPKWPENILGKINQQDNAQGKVLYDQYCLRCHVRITSSFQVVPIKWNQGLYPLKDVGTDPNSTVNVHSRLSMQTGRLQGQPVNIIGNKRFTGTASAQELVGNAVIGSLLHLPLNHLPNSRVIAPQIKAQVASAYTPASQPDLTKIGYEARPLHGIWATAPYLHNGSVPNLYQLLVPSAYRDPQFYVGSREYNTENVGYRSDAASGGELFDTHLDGNHNTGHDYGIGLHPDQRRQLIEYLKTL